MITVVVRCRRCGVRQEFSDEDCYRVWARINAAGFQVSEGGCICKDCRKKGGDRA